MRSNPRGFFRFVNLLRQDNDIPVSVSFNNHVSNDRSEACDLFATFFGSVFLPEEVDDYNSRDTDSVFIANKLQISLTKVFEGLSKLNVNRGSGPDLIPNTFLKNTIRGITKPLYILFNKSLNSGIFPVAWKYSRVTPIHESGDKSNVENYRPISILDSIPKFFESLVTDKLFQLLRPIIVDQQHGFLDKKSTVTNLAIIHHHIENAIENRSQLDLVYTDFAKAFDSVSRKVLISKLRELGIVDPLLSWINDYLRYRKQIVRIEDSNSREILVTSGVPQGSHLGPLLFILFINDLPLVLRHCQILLYTDDAKLFAPVNSIDDAQLVQRDLDSFITWCHENHMSVNASKCKVVVTPRRKSR